MAQSSPAYRRILLKLSGEALLGNQQFGDQLGFNTANAEATLNQNAGNTLLG